jgi:subtilisin family serine protease
MRKAAVFSVILLGVACTDPSTTPRVTPPESPSLSSAPVEAAVTPTDRHVFLMHGHSIPASFAAAMTAAGGTLVRVHPEIGVAVVRGLSDKAANDLARGKGKVERDVRFRAAPTPEQARATILADALPADVDVTAAKSPLTAAFLAFQWNMRQIHALEAWATRPAGDRKVRVAIIDTGLDPDHIDQGTLIDHASSIAFTPSLTGPPAWADDHFHGTHVGGLVVTNNIGTAGVAPEVTLIAIKVFNAAEQTTIADLLAAFVHAANVRADVANLSLGAYFPKSGLGVLVAAFNRAVNYANRHDVLVVSAAGNDNIDLQHNRNSIMVPCESGTGMCVSSTGPTDTKSTFSNYGASAIDVAAPGGEALGPAPTHWVLAPCSSRSAIPALAACKSRGRYLFVIGTSQAAPQVSGTAAYLDAQYGGARNPAQLQAALQQCSDDIGKPGVDQFYGKGRINVFKTVNDVDCDNSTTATAGTTVTDARRR